MSVAFSFTVLGIPAPKGSMRAFVNRKTGRAQLAQASSPSGAAKLDDWKSAVRGAAVAKSMDPGFTFLVDVPIRFTCVFRMPRIKGHYLKGVLRKDAPVYHTKKPDGDKLQRATWDCITGILWDDDSRCAEWHCRKIFADRGQEGAWIKIESL